MASFLHIFIKPKVGTSEEYVKNKMNTAVDWYRYSDNNWIVKTTSDATKWQERLKPLVDDSTGSLFIVEINIKERQGWMIPSFWEWLKGKPVTTSKSKTKNKKQ